MNFLCPACRTPLPNAPADAVVPCTHCGVQIDLTRLDTSPGTARMWPDVDLSGERLGEYQLVKRLASGGMGIVYEAEFPGSLPNQGRCAVKVLAAILAADPALRTRFAREAAALRALQHPGIVRVLAEGEDRGFCWYAMERVDGPDLRARIEQGPLPADEVAGLARSLLRTLEAVHAKGFVHRDIKPGNILLSGAGPKLCDFGIARLDGSTTLTESAAVLGSLRYMSPEQRLGRATAQSDLYALGVVLHEALAGKVPGEARLPKDAPHGLRTLIKALLAEREADRPADAAAALRLLDHPGMSRTAMVALAGSALFVALAGFGLILGLNLSVPKASRPAPKGAVTRAPAARAPVTKESAAKGAEEAAGPQQAAPEQAQQAVQAPSEAIGTGPAPIEKADEAAPAGTGEEKPKVFSAQDLVQKPDDKRQLARDEFLKKGTGPLRNKIGPRISKQRFDKLKPVPATK